MATAYYGRIGAVNDFVYVELTGQFETLQAAADYARSLTPPEGFILLAVSLPSDPNALLWLSEERGAFEKMIPFVRQMDTGQIRKSGFVPQAA
ncbi:hypothetical protein HY406_01710 [Candidatus Giovannonibacteria bacterium]|nr:hypothetical protein [Candidatus Giovannonibacteria bacterium]